MALTLLRFSAASAEESNPTRTPQEEFFRVTTAFILSELEDIVQDDARVRQMLQDFRPHAEETTQFSRRTETLRSSLEAISRELPEQEDLIRDVQDLTLILQSQTRELEGLSRQYERMRATYGEIPSLRDVG